MWYPVGVGTGHVLRLAQQVNVHTMNLCPLHFSAVPLQLVGSQLPPSSDVCAPRTRRPSRQLGIGGRYGGPPLPFGELHLASAELDARAPLGTQGVRGRGVGVPADGARVRAASRGSRDPRHYPGERRWHPGGATGRADRTGHRLVSPGARIRGARAISQSLRPRQKALTPGGHRLPSLRGPCCQRCPSQPRKRTLSSHTRLDARRSSRRGHSKRSRS